MQALKQAIVQLFSGNLAEFSHWFEEYRADAWDSEFEADVKAGKLDGIGREADRNFEDGLCKRVAPSNDL